MTAKQKEFHDKAGEAFHFPAIVSRAGGPPASVLNVCGICGAQIVHLKVPGSAHWTEITEDEADRIRRDFSR
jgi:hypothetical protein